jgi:putative ABC transport system permease protein
MYHPPSWLDRLLNWFCHPDMLEDLQGDLYELYLIRREAHGATKANLLYCWWVIRSFRYSALRWTQSDNQKYKSSMIINLFQNIKVSWRVLKRDTFNTALNTIGLTIGIACFILLGLYVVQETSFDQFHSKKDRIFRAWLYEDYGEGQIFFNSTTPFLFEEIFEKDFPEIETAVQYTLRSFHVGREEKLFNVPVGILSPEFFDLFDFNIVKGNISTPLEDKESVVITQQFAHKYFGQNDPIGAVIGMQINDEFKEFVVSAVLEDFPKNSSIQFELAISNINNEDIFGARALQGWFTVAPETYVLLKESNDIGAINSKSQDVVMSYLSDELKRDEYNMGFQPLTDIHLNPDIPIGNSSVSNPKYVYVLGVIGVLVLLIAAINYTTLTVGQSIGRTREVGMRKVLGAGKSMLVFQYLVESIIVATIAMLIGAMIAIISIPLFNSLTGAELAYSFVWWHGLLFLGLAVIIGVTSGIYPVWVLSGGKAVHLIQGNTSVKRNHMVRSGLMVFQFLITVFLISSAFIMKQQLDYLHDMDLGYNTEAVISIPMFSDPQAANLPERIVSAQENALLLKNRLSENPSFSKMTTATHVMGSNGWANLAFTDDKDIFRRFRFLAVDHNFLDAFEIPVVAGRGFEAGNGLDSRQSILLNEAAVSYFGLEDPIGKKLPNPNFGEHQIIGVVSDFHFASLHHDIEPLVITQNTIPIFQGISDGDIMDSMIPKLLVTYRADDLTQIRGDLTEAWEATFPSMPLQFDFLDDRIATLYESERRMKQLVNVATLVAMAIASIGLLGLSVLVTNSRQKEIGIRKVLGADISQVMLLMMKSFSWQLGMGIALSIPITVILMQDWLADFSYRIGIGAGVFVMAAMVTVGVSILVVSYHTFRAAHANPVKSLRTE